MLLALMLASTPATPADAAKVELSKRYPGAENAARIAQGLHQLQTVWRAGDGDLKAFALQEYIGDAKTRDETFQRFEYNLEQLDGYALAANREMRRGAELDIGPMRKVDATFAALDTSAHIIDDLFAAKLAFVAMLNYPHTPLAQRLTDGMKWSRQRWAEERLTDRFALRIPAAAKQAVASAQAASDLYIANYNIWMHHVLSQEGKRLFPKGKRLLSHWNLRDELKADYALPDGAAMQRVIVKVMERIVTQTIPEAVIDNPKVDWNPFTNAVTLAPSSEVEEGGAASKGAKADVLPEPNTRYQKWIGNFQAQRAVDAFAPSEPTAIARAFDLDAQMSEARVKKLLTEVLGSPLVSQVAAQITARLQRPLEPADLWYDGFLPRSAVPESELDAKTRARYPTAEAFAKDIPRILQGMGFSAEKAAYFAEHIAVDPARGSGHALQSARRGDEAHLRTRVEADGMNYKGYNIAIHELGHNIEQVASLYEVDHTLLAGVPNTAFTEAIAMVFQARDLEFLGMGAPSVEELRLRTLSDFWQTWEIAGVALVDIAAWHWLYEHPKATPAQFKAAVLASAREVWNKYYAPVLGGKDTPILAIYSHLVSYPLYVFNYPLGHLIAFQIKEQVGKAGPEIERMAKQGRITPDLWMRGATGEEVSAAPLLRAVTAALTL